MSTSTVSKAPSVSTYNSGSLPSPFAGLCRAKHTRNTSETHQHTQTRETLCAYVCLALSSRSQHCMVATFALERYLLALHGCHFRSRAGALAQTRAVSLQRRSGFLRSLADAAAQALPADEKREHPLRRRIRLGQAMVFLSGLDSETSVDASVRRKARASHIGNRCKIYRKHACCEKLLSNGDRL